jgi:hypothetical protein
MSETPNPASRQAGAAAGDGGSADTAPPSNFLVRLGYAVYGALSADFGCVIGALAFLILIYLSFQFAPQLTPCTSAGGIPCAP